jgi:hypothetical protein
MATDFSPISPKIFKCDFCSISCARKTEWNRHINTKKHKINKISENSNILATNISHIACECGKTYKDRTGLWRHKKTCNNKFLYTNENLDQTEILDDENKLISLILDVVKSNSDLQKQNQEFQQQMLEMCKNGINNNSNNNINSHNKTFNLNVFLNEQCKDAMNIMEFVDTIKLDLDDAESVRKLGYVNGISNIIIKHLKALDVHMRPVHCTDLKRETMYVKFQDVWEKEGDENKLIRRAIKHIAIKNYNAAETFKDVHPDCMDLESKYGEHFLRLKIEALGGSGNDNYESHTKIIKKIAKEVTIDKQKTI